MNLSRTVLPVLALAIVNSAVAAEDRTIGAGESAALSEDAEYGVLTVSANAKLDLSGRRLRANGLRDEGSLVNSAATPAALILGGDGSGSDVSGAGLPDKICLSKEGSGTLAVGHALPDRISVASGTLRLKGSAVAYRFYRFDCDKTYGFAAAVMQMSEFRLFSSGKNVTAGFKGITAPEATTTASGKEGVEKLVDGDATTKFVDYNGASGSDKPCYFILEYAEPRTVDAYSWLTANDNYDTASGYCRSPKSFRLRGSNDGVTWTLIDCRVDFVPPAAAYTSTELFSFAADATDSQIVLASGVTLVAEKGVRMGSVIGASTLRALSVGKTDAKYFRLTIKGQSGTSATLAMQFSEFKLYGQDGTAVFQQLKQQPTGTAATSLGERSFCKADRYYRDDGTAQDAYCAFDGDSTTKWCPVHLDRKISPDDPSSWMTLTMRLPKDAPDVAAYNFCGGSDDESYPQRIPNSWLLEASYDGLVWFVADEREELAITPKNESWYNAGVPYPMLSASGSAVPTASAVEVAPDATLKLEGGQALSTLRVDFASGAGTLENFTAAEDGTLYLENLPDGESVTALTLPLTLTGTVSASALRTWSVYVDGVLQEKVRVKFRNGKLMTSLSGMVLLFR